MLVGLETALTPIGAHTSSSCWCIVGVFSGVGIEKRLFLISSLGSPLAWNTTPSVSTLADTVHAITKAWWPFAGCLYVSLYRYAICPWLPVLNCNSCIYHTSSLVDEHEGLFIFTQWWQFPLLVQVLCCIYTSLQVVHEILAAWTSKLMSRHCTPYHPIHLGWCSYFLGYHRLSIYHFSGCGQGCSCWISKVTSFQRYRLHIGYILLLPMLRDTANSCHLRA